MTSPATCMMFHDTCLSVFPYIFQAKYVRNKKINKNKLVGGTTTWGIIWGPVYEQLWLQSLNGQTDTTLTAFTTNRVTGNVQPINWKQHARKWEHLTGIQFPNLDQRPTVDVQIGLDYSDLYYSYREVLSTHTSTTTSTGIDTTTAATHTSTTTSTGTDTTTAVTNISNTNSTATTIETINRIRKQTDRLNL